MMLSIVVPVYNEEENIALLYDAIVKAVKGVKMPWELILVDDGSQDNSLEKIKELVKKNPGKLQAVVLRRNFGQTAAIAAGRMLRTSWSARFFSAASSRCACCISASLVRSSI